MDTGRFSGLPGRSRPVTNSTSVFPDVAERRIFAGALIAAARQDGLPGRSARNTAFAKEASARQPSWHRERRLVGEEGLEPSKS
jgi:hypothetical protein